MMRADKVELSSEEKQWPGAHTKDTKELPLCLPTLRQLEFAQLTEESKPKD